MEPKSEGLREPPNILPRDVGAELERADRRLKWIWVSTIVATALAAVAFFLVSIPRLVHQTASSFFAIDEGLAVKGLLGLILLFNLQIVGKCRLLWRARNLHAELASEASPALSFDPLTHLPNRAYVEQSLPRELATARRKGQPLTLLMVEVEGFRKLNDCYGSGFGDSVLVELARRLKKATRGSDVVARVENDDFLVVLPDCSTQNVKRVLDRVGELEAEWRGRNVRVSYTSAWVDHQPGEMPSELLKRARQMLQLYKQAGQESAVPAT